MNYCPIFFRGCFIYIYTYLYYLLQYDVLQPSAKTWDFGSFFLVEIYMGYGTTMRYPLVI
jgi:hypothetical protein